MYRFARRPAWLLSHVLVLALIVGLANLGLWQLRRLDERRERNALIEARAEADPVPIESLLDRDPEAVQFRRVTVSGTFESTGSYLIDNRTLDGRPGAWVIDPLVLESGETIVVNRGFEPYVDGLDVTLSAPPGPGDPFGGSTFEATVARDAGRSCPSIEEGQDGVVSRSSCLELDAVVERLGGDPRQLVDIRAADSLLAGDSNLGFPAPVPLPELGDGRHFGYAVQWFIFMTIAIVGYPLVLRRVARQKELPDRIDREIEQLSEDAGEP